MRPFVSLFLLITLLLPFMADAQSASGTLKGRIVGSGSKAAVAYATVTLLRSDSSVAGGDLTVDDGTFSVAIPAAGSYILRISALGFRDKIMGDLVFTTAAEQRKLGDITLDKSETTLKGVEIVKERNAIEMSIDKKTFNVDKNITSAGGSAADMLQNVPSVTVDAAGNVSLRGKSNVTILIDGRPATLLAGDVASALQSLPAASVESVEVITNPSSKYDAQGSTGILNIITKKDKKAGLNGMATLGIGTRNKYNGGVNMNLRNDKWNFSLNSNFRYNDNRQITTTDRRNHSNDSASYTYSDYQRKFIGWFNALTAEYTFDSHNVISLTQNLNLMRFGSEGNSDFNLYAAPSSLYGIEQRYEKFSGGPFSSSSNINYKHKFKKPGAELTTDVTFAIASSTMRQQLNTNQLDAGRELLFGPVYQNLPGTGGNSSLNAQVDYSTPFLSKEGKLDAGLKTQNFWFNSANNPTVTMPGASPVPQDFLRNIYNYYQQTHAGYASYSDKKDKWSYQAGLRLEYAGYSGTAGTATEVHYSNDFLNLFPSAYLAYQLNKTQQVYLNYTKRTDRPFFLRMMPFVNIANALDTTSGNPNLKPEFIDNVELAYSLQLPKGNTLLVSAYLQHTSNLVQNFTKAYADGTSYTLPVNLDGAMTYGLELTGKTQILPVWDATLSVNMFQNEIKGNNVDPSISNSGFSWFSKLNTNYKITKTISVQLMGNYESAKPAAQGRLQEVYWMDAAIKASFLKDNRATLTFNVTDIFNTRKYTTNYNLPLYDQVIYRNRETRIGTLTFTYKFGRNEMSGKGQGAGPRKQKQFNNDLKKDAKDRDSNIKSGDDDGGNGGGGMQK